MVQTKGGEGSLFEPYNPDDIPANELTHADLKSGRWWDKKVPSVWDVMSGKVFGVRAETHEDELTPEQRKARRQKQEELRQKIGRLDRDLPLERRRELARNRTRRWRQRIRDEQLKAAARRKRASEPDKQTETPE